MQKFVSSKARFSLETLSQKIAEFERDSELFNLTGCVHKVMIFCENRAFVSEDIGRHNALDKAIGKAIMASADLSSAVLIVSGRLSNGDGNQMRDEWHSVSYITRCNHRARHKIRTKIRHNFDRLCKKWKAQYLHTQGANLAIKRVYLFVIR